MAVCSIALRARGKVDLQFAELGRRAQIGMALQPMKLNGAAVPALACVERISGERAGRLRDREQRPLRVLPGGASPRSATTANRTCCRTAAASPSRYFVANSAMDASVSTPTLRWKIQAVFFGPDNGSGETAVDASERSFTCAVVSMRGASRRRELEHQPGATTIATRRRTAWRPRRWRDRRHVGAHQAGHEQHR